MTSAVSKFHKKDKIVCYNFLFVPLICKNHKPNRPNCLITIIRRFVAKQLLTGRKKKNLRVQAYRKKCKRFVVSVSAELDPADRSQLDRTGEKGKRSGQIGLHGRTLSLPRPERRPVGPDGENGGSVSAGNTPRKSWLFPPHLWLRQLVNSLTLAFTISQPFWVWWRV